jgi:hypothetical protein
MPLDKIVVLAMALAFFGGIALVYWKNKQKEQKDNQASSSAVTNSVDGRSSNKLQEKEKRISKS